jgi:hypothetical protein
VLADTKLFNRDDAKQRPESWFASPLDIAEHPLLTRGENVSR